MPKPLLTKPSLFKSNVFDTAREILDGKNVAFNNQKERREQMLTVRKFTNMLPTLSEEEATRMGRTEITNHGLSYRSMSQNEGQLTSMVTITNALVEVVVDTDNAEQDQIVGQRISEAINRGAIHHKGKFANFWRKVAGEIVIAGGCPVIFPPRYGWLPKVCPDMLFPPETELDSDLIPYAFDVVDLTVCDLKKFKKAVKKDTADYIHSENIEKLIENIEEQAKGNKTSSFSYQQEISKSVRSSKATPNSIRAFWFYEPKWEESKSYVSATLVVENTNADLKGDDNVVVIVYVDRAYEDASQWCHLVAIDSEIGGVKNLDTLRGVAEMQYASALDSEEFLNLLMEGAKILAKPKLSIKSGANPDDIMKWKILESTLVPEGIEPVKFDNNMSALQVPLSILSQNASGLSATTSGGSDDLRVEALDKQRTNATLTTNRISEGYNHMESIMETVVWRLLAGETKPGADGYLETMWVRAYLDKYGIDYKKLAERKYGRFVHIRVRAHRSVGNGDRVQQIETSDWLMANLMQFAPQVRPLVIRMAVILRTQDPDLADVLVAIPKTIINSQKITAENEFDTIKRRAALGQEIPIGQDDVHQDHIPIHLLDMQALVASNAIRPWDKLDVLSFAGLARHVGEHLKILMSNKATNPEAVQFIQPYQQITQSAQAVVQEVEQREGGEEYQLTAKEQADIQLKWAAYELDARKHGLDIEKQQRLWKASEARQATIRRAQYVKEIENDKKFELDRSRVKKESKSKPK